MSDSSGFKGPLPPPPPPEASRTAPSGELEARYRDSVRAWFERLTFKGLPPTGAEVSLPLEQVYVELKVLAEVPDTADDPSAAERRLLQEAEQRGALAAEQERELEGLRYQRWKHAAWDESSTLHRQGLEVLGTQVESPAVVLLGDPGSGKTTLLHALALRALRPGPQQRLPIFVPLAAYDDSLRRTGEPLPLERFLPLYHAKWRGLPGLEPLFQRALEQGQALVLLDGLDEVLDVETRRFVAWQVRELLRTWVGRGNRFVLTSRFIGYREVRLPDEVPHFMMLDFGPWERECFAQQWCAAYAVWAAGGQCSQEEVREAKEQERLLLADVNGNPDVERLASNPLLLTLLALLRREAGPLPVRRVELYERYVRMLLEHWERNRSEGARRLAAERLEPEGLQWHLTELALWLHQHRPSATARGEDLVRALAEQVLRREGQPPSRATAAQWERAEARASLVLQEVKDIAGLLGERGRDAYGFLHLTFQEYFVGRALARETAPERWERLRPHLHDPRWKEPLAWCAAWLGVMEPRGEGLEDLVRRIQGARSEHEPVLHRDLFLAAAVGAEDVSRCERVLGELRAPLEDLRRSPIPSIRTQALETLMRLLRLGYTAAEESLLVWLEDPAHLRKTLEVITRGHDTSFPTRLREALIARLTDDDPSVFLLLTRRLGVLASTDAQVLEALLARRDDANYEVRSAVLSALATVADSDARVLRLLLSRLEDEDPEKQWGVSGVLRPLVGRHPEVREAFLARLDHEDFHGAFEAIFVLSPIAGQEPRVRDALLARLEDEDRQVRSVAVQALSALVDQDSRVYDVFLAGLGHADPALRRQMASALESVVDHDPRVRDALLCRLEDEDDEVRRAAIEALGATVEHDAGVRRALLARLGDTASPVRLITTESLRVLVRRDEEVFHALQFQFDVETEPEVRAALVQALGEVADRDAEVRHALLPVLGEEYEVRRAALDVLRGVAGHDARVRDAFLARLGVEASEEFREVLIQTLGALASHDDASRHALLARLDGEDPRLRERIARSDAVHPFLFASLEQQDPGRPAEGVVQAVGALAAPDAQRQTLLARLEDENVPSRRIAALALEGLADLDAEVRLALVARLEDEDFSVREAAARALGAVREPEPAVCHALLARLEDEFFPVQAAAATALRHAAVTHEETRRALLSRLEDEREDARQWAVEALGHTVDRHEDVRRALLAQLRGTTEPALQSTLLRALGSAAAQDREVREALVSRLEDDTWAVRATALKMLLTHVPEVLEPERWLPWLGAWSVSPSENAQHDRLAQEVRELVAQRAATLSLEDESRVDHLARLLREPRWSLRESAARALLSRPGGPPPRVLPALRGLLEDLRDEDHPAECLEVVALLLNSRDRETSRAALARAMRALDEGTQPWFDGDATGPVRARAAEILGRLQPLYREERVLQRLLRLMREDAREEAREAAYHAVLRLLAAPPGPSPIPLLPRA